MSDDAGPGPDDLDPDDLDPEAWLERVDASWQPVLAGQRGHLDRAAAFLRDERRHGRDHLPGPDRLLRAFERPMDEVRVLLLGQDPYPTPGHAVGLSFSVAADVRPLPRSLRNVLREREDDLGLPVPAAGDLSAWSEQGVMLLNRVLTVSAGAPGSHRGHGWEQVTEAAVRALARRGGPLVAVLWGADARRAAPLLPDVPRVESAHPSPLSASRGFFGSRPFSSVDAALVEQGSTPVDWRLAAER